MHIIRTETGMVETPFFGGQEIQEEWLQGRNSPYTYGTRLTPIEFTILISPLEKEWTPELKGVVGQWLIQDSYKEFQFADDLEKFYYAKCVNAADLHLLKKQGYLELTFRTNSAYAWSEEKIESFDLTNNPTNSTVTINCLSNINKPYRPDLDIELMDGETNITIRNLDNTKMESDGLTEKVFKFTDLRMNERISVDNENEFIKSNNQTSNPFAKFSGEWLELVNGENRLEITGKCKIKIRTQYPIFR